MREKITKDDIEKLAQELVRLLNKHDLWVDVALYFNGDRLELRQRYDGGGVVEMLPVRIENIDPHMYFKYAAYHHILSISFEGPLYDYIECNGGFPSDIEELFEEYGVWYELGNMWNMTFYPANDEMEIEYTEYKKPEPEQHIWVDGGGAPEILQDIMDVWWDMAYHYGDTGSCVIGAGFRFDFNGTRYKMSASSPYQGSLSWEYCHELVGKMLENVGATNITYDWGIMD